MHSSGKGYYAKRNVWGLTVQSLLHHLGICKAKNSSFLAKYSSSLQVANLKKMKEMYKFMLEPSKSKAINSYLSDECPAQHAQFHYPSLLLLATFFLHKFVSVGLIINIFFIFPYYMVKTAYKAIY